MSDQATSDEATPDAAQPFRWQITNDNGSVAIVVGDQFPKNDGSNGPRLTEDSYTGLVYRSIGLALRDMADRLIDSSTAIAYGDDDDGWDD